MGVKRAVERSVAAAQEAQAQGLTPYTLGELIHNPAVVGRLAEQGIRAVDTPEDAKDGLLILRSHGVSPEVARQAEAQAAQVLDCTCPFVKKLHTEVERFSAQGAPVILMGDPQHPEIIGTAGYCKGPVYVVSTEEGIDALPLQAEGALLAAQTTFPPEAWERLSARLLERFPGLTVRNTICSATSQRQQEASELAKQVDAMLVVGGRHSANTRKLYETCKAHCPDTHLVERAAEIPPHLRNRPDLRIGVTAGASTPDWSLEEVVNSMNDMEHKDPTLEPIAQPEEERVEAIPAAEDAPAEPVEAVEETAEETVAEVTEEPAQEAQEEAPAQEEPASAPAEPEKEPSFMDEVAASMTRIRNGQTVTGKVVQVTDDDVSVNIGYKSDGILKRSDMVDQDVQLGDEIEVEIIKVNDGEGNVILSQRNIVNRKVWDDLMQKYEAGEFVQAVGKEAVKGGLLANIEGVRAFIPASHLSQRYVEKITQFVGQPMRLKIIEVDQSKKRVVASRKEVIMEESAAKKEAVWANLVEGTVVKGIVRRFASFGAFVDIGGVDGLIHITDLSWNRSAQPQDVLQINDEIDVKILSLDRERERIQLGYKQLQARPWDNIEQKYQVGEILTRKVVRIRPFGAFVELEPGVDGLVHISQVARQRIEKVEDVLSPGQEVNVKVLGVDPDAKRISLSIKEASNDMPQAYTEAFEGEYIPYAEEQIPTSYVDQVTSADEDNPIAAAFKRAQEAKAEAEGAVEQAEVAAETAVEEAEEAAQEVAEEAAEKAEDKETPEA